MLFGVGGIGFCMKWLWRSSMWVRNFYYTFIHRILGTSGTRVVVVTNSILTLVSLFLFIFLAPVTANWVIYQGFLLWLPYIIPLVFSAFLIFLFIRKKGRQNNTRNRVYRKPTLADLENIFDNGVDLIRDAFFDRRALSLIGGIIALNILWCLFSSHFIGYLTYLTFARSLPRKEMVATELKGIRFAAQPVAFTDIDNFITAATEAIEKKYTRPVIINKQFGYVAPITPDGIYQTFRGKNPGFVYYDDIAHAPVKTIRCSQPFVVGQGMLWFDDLERHVVLNDFFAVYEIPHYIVLDPARPCEFTAVVPKIKYRWFLLPYWAGVVLVHDNGTLEDIDREEAGKDKRLQGQWIAPMTLARKYIELQNYAVGFIPSFFRVDGKLEVPDAGENNDEPAFLVEGTDGIIYLTVETKAEGAGEGLFRMYYFDSATFESSYYEFKKGHTIYGHTAAEKRVQNLQNYNWYREAESGSVSGNMIVIQPVYILKEDGVLRWKFTITNKNTAGTSAIAVVNAANLDDILEFDIEERSRYEAWLHEKKQPKKDTIKNGTDEKLISDIRTLLQQIEERLQKIGKGEE